MSAEINYLTATQASAAFAAKQLSPVELMSACIARAEAVQPDLNCFTQTYFEPAMQAAKKAEARLKNGTARRLEGLPLAVKEEFRLKGALRTSASLTSSDHVDDETEPGVVDGAGSATRRDLDNGRAINLEVEDAGGVHRVGVAGEEQRVRVHESVHENDLVRRVDAHCDHSGAHRLDRGCGDSVQEGLDTPQEVKVVENLGRRLGGGKTVKELEGPDPGLDDVRRGDLRWDGLVQLVRLGHEDPLVDVGR